MRPPFGLALLIAALLALPVAPAVAADKPDDRPKPVKRYENPVFGLDFPDPMVLRDGKVYYAYATATRWETPGHRFPILRSRDLVHWRSVGSAFTSPPAWANGNWWGPSVIRRGSRYLMYYTGRNARTGTLCIAVASATAPTGPFTHRAILSCGDSTHSGNIDPAPFVDARGRGYVFFARKGGRHSISVLPLRRSLIAPAGPPRQLFGVSQAWEVGTNYATVEAPFPVQLGSRFALLYSANDWRQNYQMGMATARSPLGPFRKAASNPILNGRPEVGGPGGGSLVTGPHGGLWLVYAAWIRDSADASKHVRNLRIDRVVRRADGTLSISGPTRTPQIAP